MSEPTFKTVLVNQMVYDNETFAVTLNEQFNEVVPEETFIRFVPQTSGDRLQTLVQVYGYVDL